MPDGQARRGRGTSPTRAPVLGLDGSLVLSDILDRPSLPNGAARAKNTTTRLYRSLDAVIGFAAISLSTWIWYELWWDVVVPLWNQGPAGRAIAAMTITPTAAALIIALAGLGLRGHPEAGS